jgi:hypothetical protein
VKLVLACCILHNWILNHGQDEVVPEEPTWEPNTNYLPNIAGIASDDNAAWVSLRDEIANMMWANRGTAHV